MTQTIADRLRDLHCQTIIAVTADKFEKEFEYDSVRALLRRRVDAIIAIPASMTSPRVWQSVLATPTKLIFVDRDLRDQFPQVDSVSINNYEGARMATRYLFSAGHTHIGYLTGPLTASTLHDRLRGYKDAFRDFSREWEREYVQECSFAIGPRLNAARKLLALDPPPTAILAPSNLLAEAVLVAIRERGQPLAEISLIMFDDVPWAALTSPRLTTVSNPTKKLGKAAIDLLQRKLTEESISRPEHIQLQVADLVVRESTHVVIANPTRPATPDDPPRRHDNRSACRRLRHELSGDVARCSCPTRLTVLHDRIPPAGERLQRALLHRRRDRTGTDGAQLAQRGPWRAARADKVRREDSAGASLAHQAVDRYCAAPRTLPVDEGQRPLNLLRLRRLEVIHRHVQARHARTLHGGLVQRRFRQREHRADAALAQLREVRRHRLAAAPTRSRTARQ